MKKLVLIFGLLILISCGSSSSNENEVSHRQPKSVKVKTEVVTKTTIPVYRSFSGTASSGETTFLVPKIMGYIEKFNFEPGDKFKKDDIILKIKSKEILEKKKFAESAVKEADNALKQSMLGLKMAKSQLAQANSNYELAKKTYIRFKNLLKSQSISQQEFDQVEAKYLAALEGKKIAENNVKLAKEKTTQVKIKKQQALSGLGEAKTFLSYTYMKAPYDGILLEKMMDVGNLAAPGQPVAKIGTTNSAIYSYFNEKTLNSVKKGDTVKVIVDSMNLKYDSKVLEISPNIDPATRNFKVKLSGHPNIAPGMYVKVLLKTGNKDIISLNKNAIVKRGQLNIVFVNKNGKAEMRLVKLGNLIGDKYEIRSGINAGDKVVVENAQNLEAGDILED
jgi:multidrug efflux pump subunit AcrA (membrane-fusion protein)